MNNQPQLNYASFEGTGWETRSRYGRNILSVKGRNSKVKRLREGKVLAGFSLGKFDFNPYCPMIFFVTWTANTVLPEKSKNLFFKFT